MLEHRLFGSTPIWRRRRRFRPLVLAIFSYRYDAELVPDLLANIEPMVDGWVAFDDRGSSELFSIEPRRRRLLIERAKELGATWVLAIDPDERVERGAATRIRGLTSERQRIVWEFNLREMFSASTYRVDGTWGSKTQGRLFPVFDGPLCSDKPLHGAWCVAPSGYTVLPTGLNLYHLKMLSYRARLARRDLYQYLDPGNRYQNVGYDYLIDGRGAVFEQIPPARDFFPAHRETGQIHVADPRHGGERSSASPIEAGGPASATSISIDRENGGTTASQLGQLRVSIGERARRDSKLAVVIIGLSAPKSLFNAVGSLLRQDTPSEIIVVNSGGGDVSGVLDAYLQYVVLVELAEPIRVGAARNIGIQMSRAPFVAFLAGDCMAAPGWVAERIQSHMEREGAVASVVDNDKTRNPFAWAAHLMTYGHRMPGEADARVAAYGASYDRALFDKYGYFSETMAIGEDSEFHNRLRRSDPIWLHDSIRTVHCNPGGPISFLADQYRRGQRGRYLTDFLRIDFTAGYIALATIGRVLRPVRLSLTQAQRNARWAAIASWPVLPIGAVLYSWGMIVSYLKSNKAERLFRKANRVGFLGQPAVAVGLLRRAIDLRPVTARYHIALGAFLNQTKAYENSAGELYKGWDISRQNLLDVYSGTERTGSVDAKAEPSHDPICLQLVIFSDSSEDQLAEFLKTVSAQRVLKGKLDLFVVSASDGRDISEPMRQLRQTYANLAKFVSSEALLDTLTDGHDRFSAPSRTFVVISSSSCIPPPDWLAILSAYVATYPEVELFYGSCRPEQRRRTGFIERMSYDLGLFPRTPDRGGILRFAHAANWACNKSLLAGSGGLTHGKRALGVWTLTERVMRAGGSSMFASDWQSTFRIDSTLTKLLGRFYRDGYFGAQYVAVTKDPDLASDGSFEAAWRFATDRFDAWRRASHAFLLHAPVFLLLLSVGLARQVGWRAGLKSLEVTSIRSQAHKTI